MQEDAGSNLLQTWIARTALAAPGKPWVVSADDDRTVSYGELHETVGRFGSMLHERGLGPNDRVALLANNSIEQLLCYFGVMASGATVCTIHVEMNRNQLGNIFTRLEPKLILYQDGLQLDDLLAASPAPRIRIGRYNKFEPDSLFAELSRVSLRQHPASFLRADLANRRIVTCIDAMSARDGKWLTTAGLVLVRQKPGSAKGVMFITIEDETGVANIVIWPSLYERQRRIILAAGMIAVQGRSQREGEVVHLVAQHLTDLSAELAGVGKRDDGFPLANGRGDEFHDGSPGVDPRSLPPKGLRTRDVYIPDLHIDTVKVKTRDFR